MPNLRDIEEFTRAANYRVDVSLNYLPEQLVHYLEMGLDLDPEFQRAHVWTEAQQIAFMEFFLRGGKSGREILFNHTNWMGGLADGDESFVLVDGKQRLHAALAFLDNKIPVLGYYYKDWTGYCKHSFHFVVNDLPSYKDVLTWYCEANSGGTPHTEEEIRRVQDMPPVYSRSTPPVLTGRLLEEWNKVLEENARVKANKEQVMRAMLAGSKGPSPTYLKNKAELEKCLKDIPGCTLTRSNTKPKRDRSTTYITLMDSTGFDYVFVRVVPDSERPVVYAYLSLRYKGVDGRIILDPERHALIQEV